jgi:hypothetical protein
LPYFYLRFTESIPKSSGDEGEWFLGLTLVPLFI